MTAIFLRMLSLESLNSNTTWPKIDGMVNFRDLGGYNGFPSNLVYRAADLHLLTPNSLQKLSKLVSVILDLRSLPEIDRWGEIGPRTQQLSNPNISRIHCPVFTKQDYSPEAMGKRLGLYAGGHQGFLKAYQGILSNFGCSLKTIFNELAKCIKENKPGILIHCTAGKDRTGLACALLLSLAGVSDDMVALEYNLTEIGLADRLNKLLQAKTTYTPEQLRNMMSSKAVVMLLTLKYIRNEYGSVREYLLGSVNHEDFEIVLRKVLKADTKL